MGAADALNTLPPLEPSIPRPGVEVPVAHDLLPDEASPAKILSLRYALEAQLAAPGSLSGPMLDALQAGLGGARPDGARRNTQEELRARLADLTLLCRGLTADQERVCRARYAGIGAIRPYARLRRLGDLREGEGEEVSSLRPLGPDGERLEGWAEVSGWRAELPSYGAIGAATGLTPGQVRGLLDKARGRIAKAIRHRGSAFEQ